MSGLRAGVWAVVVFGLVPALSCSPDAGPAADSSEGPVDWAIQAEVDKREVQVGEALELTLTVRHPPGAEFHVSTGENLAPFELIERSDQSVPSPFQSRIRLRMAAYRLPASIAIPPIPLEYPIDEGGLGRIETEPIPISLVTSLTPDVDDIHDIKRPIADAVPLPWLFWLLALLAAAILAYLLYRKLADRKSGPMEAAHPEPLLSPDEEAERALRELAKRRLLEQRRLGEFYTALAEILKRCAGRSFQVPYRERSTTEILTDLANARLSRGERARLAEILDAADLVKFARVAPPDEDSTRMLPEAFRFVESTRLDRASPDSPDRSARDAAEVVS